MFSVAFFAANILVVSGVLGLMLLGRQESTEINQGLSTRNNSKAVRPLDQLSSADVATSVAQLGNFEEVYWVAEQAASLEYLASLPPSADPVAQNPELINSTIKTRKDINIYTVQEGDTVTSIANAYGVSSDSIRWSNDLTSNTVALDTEINIPPRGLSGIVYKVKENDSVDALAKLYKVNKADLISFNDVETGVLPVDELIFLEGGTKPAPVRTYTAYTTPTTTTPTSVTYGSHTPVYGANGYVYGQCTYYIATKLGAPNGLGNANTWAIRAPSFGYTVSTTPKVGAIAQTNRGYYGHLGIVEEVSADGLSIKYSDMNGLAGWNRVGYSGWVPKTDFSAYIY